MSNSDVLIYGDDGGTPTKLAVDSSGNLQVDIVSGGGGGSSEPVSDIFHGQTTTGQQLDVNANVTSGNRFVLTGIIVDSEDRTASPVIRVRALNLSVPVADALFDVNFDFSNGPLVFTGIKCTFGDNRGMRLTVGSTGATNTVTATLLGYIEANP